MRTLDFYIDTAREKLGLTSDLQLAKKLVLKNSAISYWRSRKSWPADDTMMRLAKFAGIPAGEALIDLNIWRTEGEAQNAYKELIKRLGATVISAFVAIILCTSTAHASPALSHPMNETIYYGNYRRNRRWGIAVCFNRFFNVLRDTLILGSFCDRSGATASSHA